MIYISLNIELINQYFIQPMNRIAHFVVYLLILAMPATNGFARPNDITKEEIALTPSYCVDTEAFGGHHQCTEGRTPKSDYWLRVMGNGFCSLHHYCWAQIIEMRSFRYPLTPEVRKYLIGATIDEYLYVIKNSPEDFVLLPEVFTRMGRAELRIGNVNKANAAFAKARELKPDYLPAYTDWVDFLIKTGKRDEAKALAKEGLENAANGKRLIEQFQRLGGNLKDIVVKPRPAGVEETVATER